VKTLLAIALVSLSLSASACKQGNGDRCQVNSDCSSGTCSPAEHLCVTILPVDAAIVTVPIDAPDAGIDAAIDAPPAR
jgi:hypothetical protein